MFVEKKSLLTNSNLLHTTVLQINNKTFQIWYIKRIKIILDLISTSHQIYILNQNNIHMCFKLNIQNSIAIQSHPPKNTTTFIHHAIFTTHWTQRKKTHYLQRTPIKGLGYTLTFDIRRPRMKISFWTHHRKIGGEGQIPGGTACAPGPPPPRPGSPLPIIDAWVYRIQFA